MKLSILLAVASLIFFNCNNQLNTDNTFNWCEQKLRPQFAKYKELSTSSSWYKVYDVGEDVIAIAEPYNYQEVISYLILGKKKALLFDTGMGLDSISLIVQELTDLPITVINSHTHYDHIGSNHEFDNILAMDTAYTHKWAEQGWSHEQVAHEVEPEAFCNRHLEHRDVSNYHIKPFRISGYIRNGSILDLGERKIEIISVPGHTPDAIAILDRTNGYLWTGDTFYEATIWLFFEGTDLKSYEESIGKLADLTPTLKRVFPAHNTPVAQPERLIDLKNAYADIVSGRKPAKPKDSDAHPEDDNAAIYEFEHFSFLIGKNHIQ